MYMYVYVYVYIHIYVYMNMKVQKVFKFFLTPKYYFYICHLFQKWSIAKENTKDKEIGLLVQSEEKNGNLP